MKKIIGFLLFVDLLFGGIVDGVAISVNGEPITLYEIDDLKVKNNISKTEAADKLIGDILYQVELKKNNIAADMFETQNYIENVAKSQNLTILEFKEKLKQSSQSYEKFVEQIKKQIEYEKFVAKVVRPNIKIASEDDLKLYFENNQNKFQSATGFDVIQYSAKDKNLLSKFIANPLLKLENIEKAELSLDAKNLNPQIRAILTEASEGAFTQIFPANEGFLTILVNKKNGLQKIEFESAKNQIFETIMKQREDSYIKEFFNKMRLTAKIEVIR